MLVERRQVTRHKILKQFSANMAVKKAVLKLVFEAAQTTIARRVAIFRARLQESQCSAQKLVTPFGKLAGEASAARQCIVQKDFRFEASGSRFRECRSKLSKEFAGF